MTYQYLNKVLNAVIYLLHNTIKFFHNPNSANNKKIYVIVLQKLGDTVFTIPSIEYLNEKFNGCVSIICFPESKSIFKLALQNEIHTLPHNNFKLNNRIANFSARKKFRSLKPDIIFDLTGNIRSASLMLGLKSNKIIGFNDSYFNSIYTRFIQRDKHCRLEEMFLKIANYDIKALPKIAVRPLIKTGFNKNILIHPFAGWKAKEWGINKFIEIAINLKNKNYTVNFVFEKSSVDKSIKEFIKKEGINIFETATIDELIDEIKKCEIIIGNDSGAVYIAALLGKPTFSIYGPTNPIFSKPAGDHHEVIYHELKCSPSQNNQYCFTLAGREGCPSYECMKQLSVNEVTGKLIHFLDEIELKYNYN